VIKIGEEPRIRSDPIEIPQVQPLCSKARHKRFRARIREHALDLLRDYFRLVQFFLLAQRQELIIRDAAPEEERKPRCKLQVADAIRGPGSDAGRVALDAEEEF